MFSRFVFLISKPSLVGSRLKTVNSFDGERVMPNITYEEACELRKNYEGGPCDHENLLKEYFNSAHTGDYVCERCGESFYGPTGLEAMSRANKEDES
ncbi:hypothetical protein ADUPG1_002694, partial [Aduncisulcus paluster]